MGAGHPLLGPPAGGDGGPHNEPPEAKGQQSKISFVEVILAYSSIITTYLVFQCGYNSTSEIKRIKSILRDNLEQQWTISKNN